MNHLGETTTKTVISLFEYEATDVLRDDEIKELERFSRSKGVEILRPRLTQGKVHYQARQFVGMIRLGRRTLQIFPKIYSSSNRNQREQEAMKNLLWMLDYAGYLKIYDNDWAELKQADDWFEVLVSLFTKNLKKEWSTNPYRTYESVEATIPVLKGKWQLALQIKRPTSKHLFSVAYDEFTLDNQLNRLFRFVVEILWTQTQDRLNFQSLTALRDLMSEVTLVPRVTVDAVRKIHLSRLNQKYEPLLNLAILFLDGIGVELSCQNSKAFGLLFDMNLLFERFLTGFIQKNRESILCGTLKDAQLLPQGRTTGCFLARINGKNAFRLNPDVVFSQNKQYPLILDFKYKRLDQHSLKLGITQADFYQMYVYSNRYDCPRVTMIYPQTIDLSNAVRTRFQLENNPSEIGIKTVNLMKDLTSRGASQDLIQELQEILEQTHE